ncbi:hypothetical protein K523DRAFT_358549 [Schizophyllum commune Tattone D]|nr:hypothetical protein K523DRAFT_358549 [Schizophyllum commune Tattone D]
MQHRRRPMREFLLATKSSLLLRQKGLSSQPVSSPDEFDRHGPDAPANPTPLPSPSKAPTAAQPMCYSPGST